MPIRLKIVAPGGRDRPMLGWPGPRMNVNEQVFEIDLSSDGTWVCRHPIPLHWRYVIPEWAGGTWQRDMISTLVLMDRSSSKVVFELRSSDRGSGDAFYWPRQGNRGAVLYDGTGKWGPSSASSEKCWVGLLVKGGGGLIAGGEGAIAYTLAMDPPNSACLLGIGTARAGAVGGGGAGVALLIATGFNKVQDLDGFSFDGVDFALSFGPKWSAVLKSSSNIARLAQLLASVDTKLEAIGKAVELGAQGKLAKVFTELPGIGKGFVNGYGMLVDTDKKNMVAVDIPLAGYGAEIGVYYGWSKSKVLKTW